MMNIERFRLLDKISKLSVSEGTLLSQIQVPVVSTVLDEHFPGKPILPGVLLIEIMAQSSGYLVMAKFDFNKMAVLAKVSHCKFVDFVIPGDTLICSVKVLLCNRGFSVHQAEITRDGVVIAKAELRMKVLDFFGESAKETLKHKFDQLTSYATNVAARELNA